MKPDVPYPHNMLRDSVQALVSNRSGRSRRNAAFSAVELLVAVVIVAVLAVVLFGVFSSVSESSRSAACVAKLRQLAVGVRLWRNENQDQLAPRLSVAAIRTSQYLYEGGQILLPEQWLCPSATTEAKGAWIHTTYVRTPSYRATFGGKFSSYMVNGLAFYPANLPGMGISYTQSFQIFSNLESKVPIFLDGFTPKGSNANWQINAQGWTVNRTGRVGFRHNGRANVVFLDGHVESLTPEEVNDLKPLGNDRRYY